MSVAYYTSAKVKSEGSKTVVNQLPLLVHHFCQPRRYYFPRYHVELVDFLVIEASVLIEPDRKCFNILGPRIRTGQQCESISFLFLFLSFSISITHNITMAIYRI